MNRNFTFSTFIRLIIAALAAVAFVSTARAGEFFEKDGAALRGYDPVAYFSDNKPVRGVAAHAADYKGSTFYFSSKVNRDAFAADPAKYAPQYGGFCAFGTAGGYKAATDPEAFTLTDGKLYLNYNREIQKQWRADIPGFVNKADKNWPDVIKQTKVIE